MHCYGIFLVFFEIEPNATSLTFIGKSMVWSAWKTFLNVCYTAIDILKGAVLTSATVPWHGLNFCLEASKHCLQASFFWSSIKKPCSFGSGTGCLYRRSAPLDILFYKLLKYPEPIHVDQVLLWE